MITRWQILLCCLVTLEAPLLLPLSAQTPPLTSPLTVVGSIPGPADLIQVHGHLAYVAGGSLLRVFDLTDPSTPGPVASVTFPAKIWSFRVSGSFVYAADGWFGLVILDLSNPAAPRLRGSFKTLGEAWGISVTEEKALVANQMSGIDVIDVSNPDQPVVVGNYFTEGYARDVAAFGPLAYVVDQPTGFSVLDVSKRGAPVEVSTQQTAGSPMIIAMSSSTTAPRIACVIGAGRSAQAGWLQVYDVTDPKAPVKVAAYKTPGRAVRAAVHGSVAYVADAEGLQIVDLSEPARPALTQSYKTVGPARDVAVTETLVLVVAGTSSGTGESGAGVVILRRYP